MKELKLSLVSFEQAKKLKELGFPQEELPEYCYSISGDLNNRNMTYMHQAGMHEWEISYSEFLSDIEHYTAPYLELAAKWFRDEKDLCITVLPDVIGKYACYIFDLDEGLENVYSIYKVYKDEYEEALNAGIDKVIEILQLVKKINEK